MLVCIQCVGFVADLAHSLASRARHSSSESKHTRSGQSHNRRPGTSRFASPAVKCNNSRACRMLRRRGARKHSISLGRTLSPLPRTTLYAVGSLREKARASNFVFTRKCSSRRVFPYLPELGTNLVTALASLNMNDLTHVVLLSFRHATKSSELVAMKCAGSMQPQLNW